ncbi:MAG: hypothetical protein JNN13_00690 [Planctomycetes bacterium]|nr:hypothetical protein [Planctomycetota bacterium]
MRVSRALLLLLALGFVFWSLSSAEPGAEPAPQPAMAPGSPVATEVAADPAVTTTRREAAPTDVAPTAPPPDAVTLRGTLVLDDEFGVAHARENGTLTMRCMRGIHRGPVQFEDGEALVVDGTWTAVLQHQPDRFLVTDAWLGGRRAVVPRQHDVDLVAPHDLRGVWLTTMRLRVLGADTGSDLGDLRVVTGPGDGGYWRRFPGGDPRLEVLADGARSPLAIDPTVSDVSQRVWISAAGYAWQLVELDTREPGERTVQLRPGGDLDLHAVGGTPPAGSVLRVLGNLQSSPVAEFPFDPSRVTRVDRLPAGTWRLVVQKGAWHEDPLTLGEVDATFVAGSTTAATIVLRGGVAQPRAVVAAGTLSLGEAWGASITLGVEARGTTRTWQTQLVRITLDSMPPIGAGVRRWHAGELPPGSYRCSVAGAAWQSEFELGPNGDEQIAVVVPDPCRVRVRCIDTDSGAQVPPGNWGLRWRAAATETGAALGSAAARQGADGTFELLAPPGAIELDAQPHGYQWTHLRVAVQPPGNEVVMLMRRECGLLIDVVDDATGRSLPFRPAFALTDASGRPMVSYTGPDRLATREPGEFRLQVAEVPGYRPPPPRTVTVTAGQWTRVEVRLRKVP